MTDGLKAVQRRNNIWVDGKMKKLGPTHRIINAEAKERAEGRKPTGLNLGSSVGENQSNRPADVQKVRGALGRLGFMNASEATNPGSTFDYPTAAGTRMFQNAFTLKSDSIAHPGGETDTMMSRVTGPLARTYAHETNSVVFPSEYKHRSQERQNHKGNVEDDRQKKVSRKASKTSRNAEDSSILERRGIYAEAKLRNYVATARRAGLKHGPDNLEHFLNGTGEPRQLSDDEVEKRNPPIQGGTINEKRFVDALRGKRQSKANYASMILALEDGEEITLPEDYWEASYGGVDHIANLDMDEHLATGGSTIQSAAHNGFKAVRRGDRVFVFGTVEHKWDDVFDFEDRRLEHWLTELHPTTRPINHLGNLARDAQDFGRAQAYTNYARNLRGLRAEFQIVNGKIVPRNIRWIDQGPEVELR